MHGVKIGLAIAEILTLVRHEPPEVLLQPDNLLGLAYHSSLFRDVTHVQSL